MSTSVITATHNRYTFDLAPEGSLAIQEVGAKTSIVLPPTIVKALLSFFQRADVRERLGDSRASLKDPVTGLFNPSYLSDMLEHELQRALAHQRPVGIIMLDVDQSAQVSTTYGHDASDTLMYVVSAFLQMSVRSEDIACRQGNGEFVLILPGASLADTRKRAEGLCREIKKLQLQHEEQILGIVTVSIGVASCPEHGSSAAVLIEGASAAMQQARADGKDRVIVYTRDQ